MKNWFLKKSSRWFKVLKKKIKKNPLKSIILILISPIIIFVIGIVLLSFSVFATIGYVMACLYGFSEILEDPYRMVKWGAAYALSASVIYLVFLLAWPEIQKGTYISIFSGLVIFYILIMIWLKARKWKKK